MYVVAGATGNTGRVVAETLLAKDQKVRVLGRNAEKLQSFVEKGAEAFARGNFHQPIPIPSIHLIIFCTILNGILNITIVF